MSKKLQFFFSNPHVNPKRMFFHLSHPSWMKYSCYDEYSQHDRWTSNEQNKTVKQLAAISSHIYLNPAMKIIPFADTRPIKEKLHHLPLPNSRLYSHPIRLLIISLRTAVKICDRPQSILQTEEQNTLPPQHS